MSRASGKFTQLSMHSKDEQSPRFEGILRIIDNTIFNFEIAHINCLIEITWNNSIEIKNE